MKSQKTKGFVKNLPNILLLITINLVLIILVMSLFISRFGIASVFSVLSPYTESDVEVIEKGDVVTLRNAREKITDFNSSQVEKVELVLTEAEVNSLLREFVLRKALESKADKPSAEILKEKGLKSYTESQNSNLFARVLVNLQTRDSADFWISFDNGERWMILRVESYINAEGLGIKTTEIDTYLPGLVEKVVQDEINLALEDAVFDFNEKHLIGREITNIEFREGRILITGEKKAI